MQEGRKRERESLSRDMQMGFKKILEIFFAGSGGFSEHGACGSFFCPTSW